MTKGQLSHVPLAVAKGELHPSLIFDHWTVHQCTPGFQGLHWKHRRMKLSQRKGRALIAAFKCWNKGVGGGVVIVL